MASGPPSSKGEGLLRGGDVLGEEVENDFAVGVAVAKIDGVAMAATGDTDESSRLGGLVVEAPALVEGDDLVSIAVQHQERRGDEAVATMAT